MNSEDRSIRAVQVSSSDLIGRRFNNLDLREHLASFGVESQNMTFWNKQSDADYVTRMFDYPGSRALTRALTRVEQRLSLHARLHPHSWSLPWHRVIWEADLVHLHIIHDGYFSLSALPFLTRRKPTVWTWHDPWPMTGHCIYPLECPRWTQGCGSCPNLDILFPMRSDRTAEQFAWKKKIYAKSHANIVVASKWMEHMAMRSPLGESFRFTRIPFGLDLARYKPRDKTEARRKLGVFPGRPTIFLRAVTSPFKGVSQFVEALDRLPPDLRLTIISVQDTGLFDRFIGRHQIIEFGWTNDEDLLLDAYTACDFFAMPSTAEAFGLMAIEAMACGRPVLSFDGTSLRDVTFAPDAGLSVGPIGDVAALADAIAHLARNLEESEARGAKSRAYAEQHYDIRDQARSTADLYRRVLSETPDRSAVSSESISR